MGTIDFVTGDIYRDQFAAIGTDGTRPVVWGLGDTAEDACPDDVIEEETRSSGRCATVRIPASVADRIRGGEVSCESLGIAVEVRDGEIIGAEYRP